MSPRRSRFCANRELTRRSDAAAAPADCALREAAATEREAAEEAVASVAAAKAAEATEALSESAGVGGLTVESHGEGESSGPRDWPPLGTCASGEAVRAARMPLPRRALDMVTAVCSSGCCRAAATSETEGPGGATGGESATRPLLATLGGEPGTTATACCELLRAETNADGDADAEAEAMLACLLEVAAGTSSSSPSDST